MIPSYYRYFVDYRQHFGAAIEGDPTVAAVDQLNVTRQLAGSGMISRRAAQSMMSSALNPSNFIRDVMVTPDLHDLVQLISTDNCLDLSKITDEMIVKLWKNDIQERTLITNFGDPPLAVLPIYDGESPNGYDVGDDDLNYAVDVFKILINGQHRFSGKVCGVLKRPFAFEETKPLGMQHIEFNKPYMNFRFEDEGDAIVVMALVDDAKQRMSTEFESAGTTAQRMSVGSSQQARVRSQTGMFANSPLPMSPKVLKPRRIP